MKNINKDSLSLEDKVIRILLIAMSIILLFVTMWVILPCIWWPDFLGIYKNNDRPRPQIEEYIYPKSWFISSEELAKYETFKGTTTSLTDEEKKYKWPSKEVYWVRLVVNEEQIYKYVEEFKWLIWIMENCWVQDSISNRWNKYSDSKIAQLSWLEWETLENQVKILKDTWIDFYANPIIKKCYAKAKKEKAEWNLNFIDSISNDNLIKRLEDFQYLRIELWLTTLSI